MTTITWLGHACFLIETNGTRILIDPFLSNPLVRNLETDLIQAPKNISRKDLDVDYILVTHGHGDHLGDAESLMKANQKTILIVRIILE